MKNEIGILFSLHAICSRIINRNIRTGHISPVSEFDERPFSFSFIPSVLLYGNNLNKFFRSHVQNASGNQLRKLPECRGKIGNSNSELNYYGSPVSINPGVHLSYGFGSAIPGTMTETGNPFTPGNSLLVDIKSEYHYVPTQFYRGMRPDSNLRINRNRIS